jgi:hypothetical protein
VRAPTRPLIAGLVLLAVTGSCGPVEEQELTRETYALPAAVEQWRKPVEKYFKYQHVTWALNIIKCESGGNPNAYNSSGASGLFQHMKQYWPARATAAGFPGASPFDPVANIAASAYLLYASGPGQWSCKFSPFEDFNYQPQFYKNGVAVGCKLSCSGAKLTRSDCAVTDCAASSATCVDDTLGARCVSTLCPAQGQKKVCASGTQLGSCNNGGLSTSTCPSGQQCVASASGASCAKPTTPTSDAKASAPDAKAPPLEAGAPAPKQDGGAGVVPDAELPGAAGPNEIQGGCDLGAGAPGSRLPWSLLLPLLLLARRSRQRR